MLSDGKGALSFLPKIPHILLTASKKSILAVSTLYVVQEQSFHTVPPSAEVCIVHVIKAQTSDCIMVI